MAAHSRKPRLKFNPLGYPLHVVYLYNYKSDYLSVIPEQLFVCKKIRKFHPRFGHVVKTGKTIKIFVAPVSNDVD